MISLELTGGLKILCKNMREEGDYYYLDKPAQVVMQPNGGVGLHHFPLFAKSLVEGLQIPKSSVITYILDDLIVSEVKDTYNKLISPLILNSKSSKINLL